MPHPSVRAVVFDFDGLMFNTEDIFDHVGHELLRRRNRRMTTALRSRMMGRRAPEAFAVLVEELELTETVKELQAESAEIFNARLDEHLAPMPGLFEVLERIEQRRLPKAVATSSARPYLLDLLGRFDLQERFDVLLAAGDVRHGKPHPEIYLKAAEALGLAPAETLVFEDSETGTRAAAEAGATVVSVPNEHTDGHDFSRAHHVAESLHDPSVLALLDRGTTGGAA